MTVKCVDYNATIGERKLITNDNANIITMKTSPFNAEAMHDFSVYKTYLKILSLPWLREASFT